MFAVVSGCCYNFLYAFSSSVFLLSVIKLVFNPHKKICTVYIFFYNVISRVVWAVFILYLGRIIILCLSLCLSVANAFQRFERKYVCATLAVVLQENEHLKKFQVTWELHNKHLFESLVFSEPILHSSLPALVGQLKYAPLVHWRVTFVLIQSVRSHSIRLASHAFASGIQAGHGVARLVQRGHVQGAAGQSTRPRAGDEGRRSGVDGVQEEDRWLRGRAGWALLHF